MGNPQIDLLLERGVKILLPGTVHIGEEVDPDRIERGVVIHPGCRIRGASTLIREGAILGVDGPLTLENSQLGRDVELRGGTVSDATFLDGAGMGPNAQVRGGCLLEEGARGAHAVGIKQTILFPFVTLGSLINFCDCLMAGGTSARDHSEVGSSYIHFNYTPNQDKATPSIMGDVPRGVMLRERPIFLGGQGGLVGPARIAYGTVVAAGCVWRGDVLEENQLVIGQRSKRRQMRFKRGVYGDVDGLRRRNVLYIAELWALRVWYREVRPHFAADGPGRALLGAASSRIDDVISERIHRLGQVAERASGTEAAGRLHAGWPKLRALLESGPGAKVSTNDRDAFLADLESAVAREGRDYVRAIQSLSPETALRGTTWLKGLVRDIADRAGIGGDQ